MMVWKIQINTGIMVKIMKIRLDKTDSKVIHSNETYDVIKFRNGYAKNAPTMLVEYKGWDVNKNNEYELYLGKIIEVNYE